MIGLVGFPQQQVSRAVRRETVIAEEVRVAGGDDALARELAGVAVIGVQAVALPGIVAEHDLWAQRADDAGNLAAQPQVARQLAVDLVEENDLAGVGAAQATGGLPLLLAPRGDERGDVGVGVPCAL